MENYSIYDRYAGDTFLLPDLLLSFFFGGDGMF